MRFLHNFPFTCDLRIILDIPSLKLNIVYVRVITKEK